MCLTGDEPFPPGGAPPWGKQLPELLPGEAPKITTADCRRFLWEIRQLLPATPEGGGSLPFTGGR